MRSYLIGGLAVVGLLLLMAAVPPVRDTVLGFPATRPNSDVALNTVLNGQRARWVMVDGGLSGMFGAGLQCMPLSQSSHMGIEVLPTTPVNVMMFPQEGRYWDGGMGVAVTDENYGEALQPWLPRKYIPQIGVQFLCETSDAGSNPQTAVFDLN